MERSNLGKTAAVVLPTAFAVGLGFGAMANENSPGEYRGPEFNATDGNDSYIESDVLSDELAEAIEETPTPTISAMPSPSALPEIIFTPTPTPTVESTPTPTPEPTPTPYPYEDELPRLSTPACDRLVKIAYILDPSEEGITSDEYDAIAEEVELLHDQLESDEDTEVYDKKAMQAGRAAEVAVRNLLAKGQSEEAKTEFVVAYAVDEYCPDHQILS